MEIGIRYCYTCNRNHEMKLNRVQGPYGIYTDIVDIIPRYGHEHTFAYGRLRPSRFQLSVWQDMHGRKKRISEMTEQELVPAIGAINKGYRVFGQQSKIISLEKALARKRDV